MLLSSEPHIMKRPLKERAGNRLEDEIKLDITTRKAKRARGTFMSLPHEVKPDVWLGGS